MNIEKKILEKVDVLYDDKKWGKRIDPDEWNANFKALENAHNQLVDSLTEQVDIVDEAIFNATTEGGNNIHVDYSGGDFTLQQALDHVVNDINNRYTKLQSDTLLSENTNPLIRDISYNSQTGTFTITKKDGSVITIDTVIEKVPASMALNEEIDGSVWLVVTNQDGSQTKTNVTSLIEDTVIKGNDVINVSSSTDSVNKVTTYTLSIKPNSIGLAHVDSELATKFEETQNAKTIAVQAKDLAVNAKNNAETYASNANTYSVNSNKSATESANSALEAKRYAEQAASYKNSAESAKTSAIQAKNDSETAKTDAQAAATDASKSKIAAEQSASSASESASSASESATNASNSAASALQFKEAAALFEVNSLANKNSSAKSASAAATSETNAASSALAAQTAQTAAEKARDEAQAIAGGTVQSDWNVNDETSSEYIKNRPFYTGDVVETYVVQNASLTQSGGNDTTKAYVFSSLIELTVGTKYTVYFNSTPYERVCTLFNGGAAVLGNLSIAGAGDDTGEPFLIFTNNSSESGVYTTYISGTPSVSISVLVPEIVKIDEKYLPVATDDSYGAVKTSNLVTAYRFSTFVNSFDMIEAIEQFNKSKAVIIWSGRLVCYASYNSSDSSIYIVYSEEPFVKYKYKIDPNSLEYNNNIATARDFGSPEIDFIAFNKKGSSDTSYKRYVLNVFDGVLKFDSNPIAYRPTFKKVLLEASKWDSTSKTYSFESTYPNASYDIEVDIDGDRCTDEQLDVWIAAKPLSSSTNKIVAKGDIPTVDIPVILTITLK